MKIRKIILILLIILLCCFLLICPVSSQDNEQQTTVNKDKIIAGVIESFANKDNKIAEASLLRIKGLMQDKSMRFIAIKALVFNLGNKNEKVRLRSVQALSRSDMPPRVKEELEKLLTTEKNQSILIAIFNSLAYVGDSDTVLKLKKISKTATDIAIKEFSKSAAMKLEKKLKKNN